MWHEARRQEKKIRGLMVDYKKRAERRREFYEKIKADPAVYVRVFGQTAKVNLDPAISIAAESPQSMMPWQGDNSNMIDRFDVRAHLDLMPPEKSYPIELTKEEQSEEKKANYERYRILVENECAGLTEEQALHQLFIDEQYGAINKDGEEEKNKLKGKKAAIGYTYEDSTDGGKEEQGSEDEESEEDDIETFDLDVVLDVDTLTDEQIVQLNACGTQFGMGKKDYVKYLRRDKDEQEALKEAKMLEEEKAQFAGRKSRRERRIYKEKRLAGRTLSPPSYAARESPKYEPYRRSSSRSRSRSKSPPRRRKKLYITSFGGGEESDDGDGIVQGPALPPGFKVETAGSDSTNTKSASSCDKPQKKESLRQRLGKSLSPDGSLSPRSKDKEYTSKLDRSTSRDGKSRRSRSPRRSRSRSHRSRSRGRYSRDRRSHERGYRSRSRDRRRSYDRRDRSRSWRSRERSRGRRSRSPRYSRSDRSRQHKSRSRSKTRSSSSRSSSRSSRRSRSKSKSRSPVKPVIKRYRRESLSSKSSSESEDEKPKKSSMASSAGRTGSGRPPVLYGKPTSHSQVKLTPQEKLKRRMQIALSKQYKADKKAEVQKHEKAEQEKMDREEELRQRAMELRRREREKRHKEMEAYSSGDDDSPAHHRHDRSPSPRHSHRDESPGRSKRKSRSKSRSRSPHRKKIVDY